ncbi:unnamed protein product, partial [marine sediment metagenome]
GEKLVTDRSIALAELVKNAYDADATKAIISMKNVKEKGGTIVVKDNGLGMDFPSFINGWMRIATRKKKQQPYSTLYNRKNSGEKGIGRFACRKLANRLELETVSENEQGLKEKLKASFNWVNFEEGTNVDEIKVHYKKEVVSEETPTYTILILKDVKDKWSEDDITKVQKDLSELITPEMFEEELVSEERLHIYDPGFIIDFDIPEYTEREKALKTDFFENAWAKLVCKIDKNGKGKLFLEVITPYPNQFD